MNGRFIEGSKLYLRPLEPDDYGVRMPLWMSDREVTRYMERGTFPLSREVHLQRYEELLSASDELEMAVVTKADDTTVGVAGLHRIAWIVRSAEFRILLGDRQCWGAGLGTEALHLFVAYAFEYLNLEKVWLGVNEENERAVASYEKAGLAREGVLRREIYRNGRYYNAVRMGIVRSEYDAVVETWPVFTEIKQQLRGSG